MIISLQPVVPEYARLGRRVRAARKARGFTVQRLADEAHLGAARVALAEQGRVRLDAGELHGVINALHLPLDLLFRPSADLSRLRPL